MTVALASYIFCSVSHMSTVFLRQCVKLKEFQLLHAAPLINVSSKTVDQSETRRQSLFCDLFAVVSWHGSCFI